MTGEDAIDLANSYQICDGNPLSPSQELRLRNGMATRSDGSWAAKRVGDFGGRQGAGKTDTIIARILAGLLLIDERLVIYTAHEYPTANETFMRFGAIFEAWDDLAGLVLHERRAHGDQGFELKGPKGAELTGKRRLLFKTRTGKSGRGFAKADLLVYDEAQHLLAEHVAGSGPAKLANPRSQSWWSGSGGLAVSAKAWEMRRQAILGTGGRLSYTEHTAEIIEVIDGKLHITAPDPEDRDAWYRANPGLGRWVTEEDMADLAHELGALFPRECLCVWEPDDEMAPAVLPDWDSLADARLDEDKKPVSKIASDKQWALAVSPIEHGPQWASLGLAGRRADNRLQVEWMHHRKGTHWIVDQCVESQKTSKLPLRVWAAGPEGAFIAPLRAKGVEVVEVSSADVEKATGQLIAAAESGVLVHLGQGSLDKAVRGAALKSGANGAALWSQRSSKVEITPLVAVTVAAGGVPQVAEYTGPHVPDLFPDDEEDW